MKELFQKLSNLFNFGKENRLVNEGEETQKPVEKTEVKGEKTKPIDISNKAPENLVKEREAEAEEVVKPADKQIDELEAARRDAIAKKVEDTGILGIVGGKEQAAKDIPNIFGEGKIDKGADAAFKNRGLPVEKGLKEKGMEEKSEDMMDRIAEATIQDQKAKEMEFTEEEVAQMMKEAEAEEVKPEDEALMAAANKAGVEAEATGELEKGFDLSEEGGKEMAFTEEEVAEELGPFEPMDLSEEGGKAKVAGGRMKEDKKTK